MSEFFRGKYRSNSARMKTWDYGSPGAYFVTICTKDRECVFGEIKNGIMGLNELGCAATRCWINIPRHFPIVELDAWIVMPNHIHGIIVIHDNQTVGTQNFASPLKSKIWTPNRFGPQSMNLASIIRGFKIGVTKYARLNKIQFQWQTRYYDRIIRDEAEWNRIRDYINQNPANWETDRNGENHFGP